MDHIKAFKPELATVFRDLNLDWLQEYFYVEPHDRNLLEDCEAQIIGTGGHIFFFANRN